MFGEMAEWSNAAVLKTVDLHGSGGSNPSLSAEKWLTGNCKPFSYVVSLKHGPNSVMMPFLVGIYHIFKG